MASQSGLEAETRTPLTRERVLQAAVDIADREGIAALTMRNLAAAVGVEAMSLYYHVANKEAVLDGIVEVVVAEINATVASIGPPATERAWKRAIRERILTARKVLLRHPWAPSIIETRASLSVETILYFDGLLGLMRHGGFSYDLAHHALHALGSRALGFTQELFQPGPADESDESAEDDAAAMKALEAMAEQVPHLMEMLAEITHDADPESTLGWCDDQAEFEFGLDLLLDGLERLRIEG